MTQVSRELIELFARDARDLRSAFALWAEDGTEVRDLIVEFSKKLPKPFAVAQARFLATDLLTGENLLAELKRPGIIALDRAEDLWMPRREAGERKRLQHKISMLFKSKKSKMFLFLIFRKMLPVAPVLKSLSLVIPPLRQRPVDLDMTIRAFLAQKKLSIDEVALARLLAYPWPGNDQELRACLEILAGYEAGVISVDELPIPVPMSSGEELYPQDLPATLRR